MRALGLDLVRGERRAARERRQSAMGESVTKRRNISPSRGRELAAAMAAEATADREKAAADRAAAEHDRARAADALQEAEAAQKDAQAERKHLRAKRDTLAAQLESMMVGAQAILAEEISYAPPTPQEREGLAWGRNRPQSMKRRAWLSEKIQPARDWIVGFARAVFGYQQERQAERAQQAERAEVIADAEARLGCQSSKVIRDIVADAGDPRARTHAIPNAWAVPKDMKAEQIDRHLTGC